MSVNRKLWLRRESSIFKRIIRGKILMNYVSWCVNDRQSYTNQYVRTVNNDRPIHQWLSLEFDLNNTRVYLAPAIPAWAMAHLCHEPM